MDGDRHGTYQSWGTGQALTSIRLSWMLSPRRQGSCAPFLLPEALAPNSGICLDLRSHLGLR